MLDCFLIISSSLNLKKKKSLKGERRAGNILKNNKAYGLWFSFVVQFLRELLFYPFPFPKRTAILSYFAEGHVGTKSMKTHSDNSLWSLF